MSDTRNTTNLPKRKPWQVRLEHDTGLEANCAAADPTALLAKLESECGNSRLTLCVQTYSVPVEDCGSRGRIACTTRLLPIRPWMRASPLSARLVLDAVEHAFIRVNEALVHGVTMSAIPSDDDWLLYAGIELDALEVQDRSQQWRDDNQVDDWVERAHRLFEQVTSRHAVTHDGLAVQVRAFKLVAGDSGWIDDQQVQRLLDCLTGFIDAAKQRARPRSRRDGNN
jgi:hypothetical protein